MELCSASGPGVGGLRIRDRLAHLFSVPDVGVMTSTPSGARARNAFAAPTSKSFTGRSSVERLSTG
eukprot:5116725-Heterocapsa_arctica.AAC.1